MPKSPPGARQIAGSLLFGLPLLAVVVVMAGRVGATARFVTWPIVVFTAVAAVVAVVGVWFGVDKPVLLAAGVLPGSLLAYLLPVFPVIVLGIVLLGLGALAVAVRGIAAGIAMTVGAAMVLATVAQGPVVECADASVSTSSGPWWVQSPTASSGSGAGAATGQFAGITQVGDRRYSYACAGGRLTHFERTD
ncbi:MAG TPA: hypothetical protein VMZ22_04805 [Acidimicrobiales bacterium]|nr:hypothetical protein [Acidimicrobiales bacterium]